MFKMCNNELDINDIIYCFHNKSELEYLDKNYAINYNSVYSFAVMNKINNCILYDFLSHKVSNVNLFGTGIIDLTRINFNSYIFLNNLIDYGLDCSALHLSDSQIVKAFRYILFDNIKYFCQIKMNKSSCYKIIFSCENQSSKMTEFIVHCRPIEQQPIINRKWHSTLEIINNFDTSPNDLVLFLINEYVNRDCKR